MKIYLFQKKKPAQKGMSGNSMHICRDECGRPREFEKINTDCQNEIDHMKNHRPRPPCQCFHYIRAWYSVHRKHCTTLIKNIYMDRIELRPPVWKTVVNMQYITKTAHESVKMSKAYTTFLGHEPNNI